MEVSSAGVGAAGAMTCGVLHAGTCGCIKADNNDVQVQMLGHMSSMGWVTDAGEGLSGYGNIWRWGNPDVSSMRCNRACKKHCFINSFALSAKSLCIF